MKNNFRYYILAASVILLACTTKLVQAQAFFDNTIDADNPLPVRLVSLTATKQEGNVTLNWITSTEINNSHFDIERSFNGQNFEVIGTVAGRGNTVSESRYQFIDHKVPNVTIYYRLKQVDFDGAHSFSSVAVIKGNAAGAAGIAIYPNPVTNTAISLAFENTPTGKYTFTLLSMNGTRIHQQVFNHNVPTEVTQIYLNAKPARGIYLLQINNGTETTSQKIIID
jgi:hypothetical protein